MHYLVQNEKGFRLYCRKILKLVIKNLLLVNKNASRWYKIRISWFFYCLKKREFPRNNHNFQDILKVLEFVNPTFSIFDIIVRFRLHCIWSLECLYFFFQMHFYLHKDLDQKGFRFFCSNLLSTQDCILSNYFLKYTK